MNSAWKNIFKQQPSKSSSGLSCKFCNSKFRHAGALGTHIKFAHRLEMHPQKAIDVNKMFATLSPPSRPTKKSKSTSQLPCRPLATKIRKLRTNHQKLKLILAWEKLKDGEKSQFLLRNEITRTMMRRYVRQKNAIVIACKKTGRILTATPKPIRFGFPVQREKLYQEILSRREGGLVVDCKFIQTRFKQIVHTDKPPGWKKVKASPAWRDQFLKQYELTSQVKTNKKSKSIAERLPAVKRFHQYTVYGAAYVLPSIYKK